MRELYLSHNQIKVIPHEIGQLVNLLKLSFSCNQIKYIPHEIEFLVNLRYLYLHDNQIKNIPNFKEDLWGACAETPAAYPLPILRKDLWGACAETPAAYPIPCELGLRVSFGQNLEGLYLHNNKITEIFYMKESSILDYTT